MLRSVTQSLFIWPTLLLCGFVGMFAFTQYQMAQSDETIRQALAAPTSSQALKLQDTIWAFWQELESYDPATATPEAFAALTERLYAMSSQLETQDAAHDGNTDLDEGDRKGLSDLRQELERLRAQMPEDFPLRQDVYQDIRHRIDAIANAAHGFNQAIIDTHHDELQRLLDLTKQKESRRNLLSILIWINAIVLIALLLRNTYNCRRNAALAQTVEDRNVLFAAALQSTHVGVLIRALDKPEHPVVFVNQAITTMTGYTTNDIAAIGADFLFGWGTDPATVDQFRQATRLNQPSRFELLVYRKNGAPFWSEWHISPVFDRSGEVTHYVSLLTDMTGLRKTREELLSAKDQAERAGAVKANFLATMSHEIRTPINGLLGVLNLMGDTSLDAEQRRLLNVATTSGHALHAIINDVLDFSKIEAGKLDIACAPFSLRGLLRAVLDLTKPLSSDKGLTLGLDVDGSVPDHLLSDEGRIRQILLNLVTNAIKFTDRGGITLRVVHLLNQERNGQPAVLLRFEIVDTGIGISAADQNKLFKEFSQIERSYNRRFGGTGLGLAITQRLVKLLDGEMGVESKPSQGSKFWFILPLAVLPAVHVAEEHSDPHKKQNPVAPLRAGLNILLVEDNATNQLVASRYLQKAGCNPDLAASGIEAIRMAQAKAYDLILMDISMPEMDGLEATGRLRALGGWAQSVPIIALTAHVLPGDKERCLDAGMNDFLNKPLDYDVLLRTLAKWTLPDTPNALAVFDAPFFQRLVDELGKATAVKIADVFLGESARRVTSLTNTSSPKLKDIAFTAHTLKSSSANCGLQAFAALMAELESAAQKDDVRLVQSLLKQTAPAYAAACQALSEEYRRHKT